MNTKLALIVLGGSLLLSGCVIVPEHEHRAVVRTTYAYEYYPAEEVYFYPGAGVYYWIAGGVWRSGPRLPQGYVLHNHVRVELNGREPWRYHTDVRRQYPRDWR